MNDQVQPAGGPVASGPGPDGAGFAYRGAGQELIVVARPAFRPRAGAEGVRSAAGADVSALNVFLGDEQLVLEPLFGGEERLRATASGPEIRRAVHAAFAGERPDVRVWFSDDEVVCLVITG
ncbi:hypothetical protein PV726_21860 [Streptomyces europaeiscabiei]|uniref:hypothetical protein n=1 Tax=Streptomyces europaeiscabiei TaxID=146819 RepID=UPI0029A3145E|nr:hypothetical protein [Streptomyces europaeiscabiei]MDX3692942.1 hypothetical protein [Streptomyces europaeiscabiei]